MFALRKDLQRNPFKRWTFHAEIHAWHRLTFSEEDWKYIPDQILRRTTVRLWSLRQVIARIRLRSSSASSYRPIKKKQRHNFYLFSGYFLRACNLNVECHRNKGAQGSETDPSLAFEFLWTLVCPFGQATVNFFLFLLLGEQSCQETEACSKTSQESSHEEQFGVQNSAVLHLE